MEWILVMVVTVCFAGVLLVGAPYLPTLRPQIMTAFELLELKPGQCLLELGCGDGKVLVEAGRREIYAIGYELNPIMFFISWVRTRRYRQFVQVRWQNFWNVHWPETDAVYVFLLDKYMKQLDERMRRRGGKLLSIAFQIPNRKADQVRRGVYLYNYPPPPKKLAK